MLYKLQFDWIIYYAWVLFVLICNRSASMISHGFPDTFWYHLAQGLWLLRFKMYSVILMFYVSSFTLTQCTNCFAIILVFSILMWFLCNFCAFCYNSGGIIIHLFFMAVPSIMANVSLNDKYDFIPRLSSSILCNNPPIAYFSSCRWSSLCMPSCISWMDKHVIMCCYSKCINAQIHYFLFPCSFFLYGLYLDIYISSQGVLLLDKLLIYSLEHLSMTEKVLPKVELKPNTSHILGEAPYHSDHWGHCSVIAFIQELICAYALGYHCSHLLSRWGPLQTNTAPPPNLVWNSKNFY